MLKIRIGLHYLKVQILERKLQAENTTKLSFNRDFQRLSAFKLTIWNDTSFLSLCKIPKRLKIKQFPLQVLQTLEQRFDTAGWVPIYTTSPHETNR